MALFGKKSAKPAKAAEPADDEPEEDKDVPEVADESSVELKSEALAPKKGGGRMGGLIKSGASLLVITLIAGGGGTFLGTQTAANLEAAFAHVAPVANDHPLTGKFTADTMLKTIDPVITNLGSPTDTWVRLKSAMVFKTGGLANPDVTAAEIRQDEIAYLRTIDITQLEGPSALQHLREDLNERASLRTNGKVTELVIQTLIVQ